RPLVSAAAGRTAATSSPSIASGSAFTGGLLRPISAIRSATTYWIVPSVAIGCPVLCLGPLCLGPRRRDRLDDPPRCDRRDQKLGAEAFERVVDRIGDGGRRRDPA